MKTNSLDFDAQALREKILDLAMRGKLVPQDPNDEPASVLLEKIKAEKAELIKEKKIKKTKPLPPITDDEKPFDIPDSWEWVRCKAVTTMGNFKTVNPSDIQIGENLIELADIEANSGHLIKEEIVTSTVGSNKYVYTEGDVLFAKLRPYLRKVLIAPNDGVCTTELLPIKGINTNNNFLYYVFLSDLFFNQIKREMHGVNLPRVSPTKLGELIIPLPPLSEQSRIAAKIAQLFALLRKVETSTQQYAKLQTLLKSKVLDLAMRGKLVKQDPNDEPASVLLEKIKAEKQELIKEKKIKKTKPLPPITDDEKPFDIPDSWEWVRLGDIFSINDRNKANIETEVGFLPMKDISDGYDGTYTFETRRWGDIKSGYTHIKNGDIALAKITPCFQNLKSCVVNNLPNKIGAATTEIYALNPILKSFSYLYVYFLKSPFFINSGMKNFTGNVGQQRVPKKFVETFVIPLPPLNEQFRIKNCLVKLLELLA
ncbi:restriction endonuclease subunit S [Lactobacillus helveticus]|uniref:restriction endonuclease subunit S n=3 Tax=Bacillati TaxID=1783272 RepID=UPI00156210F0|nr:Type-1 restriction enzyme EcoKI specificity protein [Lactobacillus helveticus]